MQNSTQSEAVKALMVPRILWGAMSFSILMYGFVLTILNTKSEVPEETFIETLGQTPNREIAIMAIGLLVLSRILPGFLWPKARAQFGVPKTWVQAIQIFYVPYIVGLALVEGTALLGFVISFLSHQSKIYYLFGGIAFLNMIIRFPTERHVAEASGMPLDR